MTNLYTSHMTLKSKTLIFIIQSILVYAQSADWSERMTQTAMSLWPAGYPNRWNYEQGLVMRSVETVWEKNQHPVYFQYIQGKVNYFVNNNGQIATYNQADFNLDHIASGKSLLWLYRNTSLNKYKLAADLLKSQLNAQPRTFQGGFWHKKIYPYQMWLDGLYMAGPFYAEYTEVFGQNAGFDDIAKQFIVMEKMSRDSVTGLLYHAWDESKQQSWADSVSGRSSSFWGRSMGWYAMGLVDVLDYIPDLHPKRDTLIQILQRLAPAIVNYRDQYTGVWYQVPDKISEQGNYPEASASCMFVYALAKAARKGYLERHFWASAKLAYDSTIKQFIEVDANNRVHLNGTCAATGLGGNPYRDGSYNYYISVLQARDDARGVGAFILASVEIEKGDPTVLLTHDPLQFSEHMLHPNPVENILYLRKGSSNKNEVRIFDVRGEVKYVGIDGTIDMSSWKPGIYFLQSDYEEGRVHKLIKQ